MVLPTFSPSNRDFLQNPYPHFDDLCQHNPVHWIDDDTLVVASYEGVRGILSDRDYGVTAIPDLVEELALEHPEINALKLIEFARKSMVFTEGDDHRRLKKAIQGGFTARKAADQEAVISQCAEEIVSDLPESGVVDLIPKVAHHLSVLFLRRMFGLDASEAAKVENATKRIRTLLQPRSATIRQLVSGVDALNEGFTLFKQAAKQVEQSPFMQMYSEAMYRREVCEEEMLMMCLMTYVAGHETSQALIGNALVSLSGFCPEVLGDSVDRQLSQKIVQETLRFEPPLQVTTRRVKRELSLNGHELQKGQMVLLLLGAANRDQRVFSDPHTFEIGREEARHLSFGVGLHTCLGSHFAKLEAEVMIWKLLSRYHIAPTTTALRRAWRPSSAFLRSAHTLRAEVRQR
ncbi:MAG: cytochrome P450 [Parvularculaceae bacterium]|nr:MAG: cytochrome P450 [Parvularculaceae bacterium]